MSYDAQEKLGFGAEPYELYLFQGSGILYALTSADEAISYLGQNYTPATIWRDEVDQSSDVTSGQLKIFIPNDHPLAQLMLPYLPASPVSIVVYGSHYGDTETAVLFTGVIASANFTDECELTCNSEQYLLQRKIPTQLYQAPCTHIFGDAGCGIVLGAHTYTGIVTAIDATGTILTVPAFASIADSLQGGFLRVGNVSRMIVAHTGSSITLLSPVIGLAVGGTVSGVAGCELTFVACTHYNNVANFLGFDLIPILNPFDGSAAVG